MALIVDPDLLTDSALDDGSTNVYINTSAQTIKLVPGQGSLVAADGVTIKAVYSFLKEEWINDPLSKNLAAFDFPMIPITDEFYELVDGWNWGDTTTRQSIRSGGWLVRNTSGNKTEHWPNITALGSVQGSDQLYYDIGSGAVNFTFQGAANEAIQIQSDPSGDESYSGGFNLTGSFAIYNRERAQIYNNSNLSAIGVTDLLAPKAFAFPIGSSTDTNISALDNTITGSAPYTGMTITFNGSGQSRTIGASSYNFGIIIDGNNGTKQQIYEFVQWALRQNTDQDDGAGTLNGNVMPELLEFVGSTLKTKTATNYQGGGTGVYIDNFQAADTNDLAFIDNLGIERTFPFVAAGTLAFNTNLSGDTSAEYFVYFTDGVTGSVEYGNSTAIFVEDNAGNPITGSVNGSSSLSFDFDYDGNVQGGRTSGTDANITAIAIGLDGAQYVKTTTTIARSTANTVNFVAAVERNYQNPS